jgi:RHS repeat-associated protein
VTKDFVFMGDRRIAFVSIASGNPYYYLPDNLGSTAVIASGDGKSIQWEADNYPFGNQRKVFTSSVNNPYQFTGDEYDSDTQFDYSVARFEAGRWGRFLSPDPYMGSMDVSNPQTLNRYSYVANNPTNAVDPSGMKIIIHQNWYISAGQAAWNDPFCEDDNSESLDPCGFGPGGPFGSVDDSIILGGLPGDAGSGNGLPIPGCILPGECGGLSAGLPPGIASAPCANAEFGCPTNSFGPGGIAVGAGGTVLCQILEPCGVVEDIIFGGEIIAAGGALVYEFAKGGHQNIRPSWAEKYGLPRPGESGKDYAERVCRLEYPPDGAGCGSGPGSDFEKLKKWADRRR